MASIQKVISAGVCNWLRHNNRTIKNDKNTDIDYDRTQNNRCLTPYISEKLKSQYSDPDKREEIRKREYEHYKKLKEQFFCYNRKDVNTLVSVVVTLPKEITDPEIADKFFQGVADFLSERYGNCVSITVHRDEGKHYVKKDLDGNPILDKDGNKIREWHEGRDHLHYTFIPTVKINHAAIAKKKNPVKAMFGFQEKISAKERIDRKELLHLHPDMNKYINETCKIKCNLNSGITKTQGGNKTVAELKKEFDQKVIRDLTVENEQLRAEIETVKADMLRDHSLDIAAKDRQIHEEQLRSAKLEQQLSNQKSFNKEISEQIRDKDAVIHNLKTGSQTKDATIERLQEEVQELRHELRTIEQTKEAEIAAKDQEISSLKTANADLEIRLAEKDVTQTYDQSSDLGWGATNDYNQTAGWELSEGGWNSTERSDTTWDVEQ